MKTIGLVTVQAAVFSLILAGCYLTREPARYRDEYFQPVTAKPQRNHSTLSTAEVDRLRNQIEIATKAVIVLRDSLASLQMYSGSLLVSTRALVDRVNNLETKELFATTKQKDVELILADLRSQNRQLSQQLSELSKRPLVENTKPEPTIFSPASMSSSLRSEYAGGLLLFYQKQYGNALTAFNDLKDKGIEEDLADNCDYWIGECRYAKHEYQQAIEAFQKVLVLEISNKKIDAYFMIGKSYELIGDPMKARRAYEELNKYFPENNHFVVVQSRLNVLKNVIPSQKNTKHKKTTI